MYFLERKNIQINHGISRDLLEHILRSVNPFVNDYMMIRKVEEEINSRAIAEGEQ